jgi:hypothetical protein
MHMRQLLCTARVQCDMPTLVHIAVHAECTHMRTVSQINERFEVT